MTTQTTHDAPPLYRDGCDLLIVPMTNQPIYADGQWWVTWRDEEISLDDFAADRAGAMPFASGDRIRVKEEWRVHKAADELSDSHFAIAAQTNLMDIWYPGDNDGYPGKVRPASTMPDWAIRNFRTITAGGVGLAGKTSNEDAKRAGMKLAWRDESEWTYRDWLKDAFATAYPTLDWEQTWVWKIELEVQDA